MCKCNEGNYGKQLRWVRHTVRGLHYHELKYAIWNTAAFPVGTMNKWQNADDVIFLFQWYIVITTSFNNDSLRLSCWLDCCRRQLIFLAGKTNMAAAMAGAREASSQQLLPVRVRPHLNPSSFIRCHFLNSICCVQHTGPTLLGQRQRGGGVRL